MNCGRGQQQRGPLAGPPNRLGPANLGMALSERTIVWLRSLLGLTMASRSASTTRGIDSRRQIDSTLLQATTGASRAQDEFSASDACRSAR